jgi:hypothetical protein
MFKPFSQSSGGSGNQQIPEKRGVFLFCTIISINLLLVPELHLGTTVGAKLSPVVKHVPQPSLGTELTYNRKKILAITITIMI